jgi:hypothetical protein
MKRCSSCKEGILERSTKPEHIEDLGGVVVKVVNAVKLFRCGACGEETTAIPDMLGLVRAAAIGRALNPICLEGKEVRFMRRALDMTQDEFGAAMDLSGAHVCRWENDRKGIGAASEKLVRHNICALLYKVVVANDYDPAAIAGMRFRKLQDGEVLPLMEMRRVLVKHDHQTTDAWDRAA